MKNLTKLFLMVAALFTFACTTDVTEDLSVDLGLGGDEVTLTISLEESRTQLGEKVGELYPLTWSAGDKISVNGVESAEAAISGEDPTKATFAVTASTPYCIAYPAAAVDEVLFAEKQQHVGNTTFGSGVSTMYAYSENGLGVQMKHLTGVLKIGVVGSAKITAAQISTIDRQPISGAFAIDFKSGKLTAVEASKSTIDYSFGEGVQLSGEPTYMHIAVPAGKYDKLYVTLYDAEGGVMFATVNAGTEKPLAVGKVREFVAPINYKPNTDHFVIHDYASLLSFVEQMGTLEKDALLVNDIEIPADKEWVPITNTTYAKTIYGHGYAIKGLTKPLFETLAVKVEGLHIDGVNIVETANPIVGAFARYVVEGAVVKNCSAKGTLTVNNTTYNEAADKTYVQVVAAGMFGKATSATFLNCANYVNLTATSLSDATIAHYPTVGGFLGVSMSGVVMEGCKNHGSISYEPSATLAGNIACSGVVGLNADGVGLDKLKNCENHGDITLKVNTTGVIYLSGVTGRILNTYPAGEGDHSIYDNMRNYGKLSVSGAASQLICGGVIGNNIVAFTSGGENHGDIEVDGTYSSHVLIGGVYRNISPNTKEVENTNLVTKLLYQNLKNTGDITIKGTATIGGTLYIGGICSESNASSRNAYLMVHYANLENSGDINVGGATIKNNMQIGGIWRYNNVGFTINNVKNTGNLTISPASVAHCRVGGLAAFLATENYGNNTMVFTDCSNSGKISVAPTTAKSLQLGGIVGFVNPERNGHTTKFVNVNNSGDIVYGGGSYTTEDTISGALAANASTGDATGNAVGGLIGWLFDYVTVDTCVNSGNITVNPDGTSTMISLGGLVGRNSIYRTGTTTIFTSCQNTGDLLFDGRTISSLRVGGFIGITYSENTTQSPSVNPWEIVKMTSCYNKGAIAIGSNAKMTGGTYVGTFIGYTQPKQVILSDCHSENNAKGKGVSISGTGAALYTGMFGRLEHQVAATSTLTNCSNDSDLTIEADATYTIPYLSSGLSGYSNTDDYLTVTATDCAVTGDFTLKGTFATSYLYYGGFYGYNKGPKMTITNSTHSGNILIEGNVGGRVTIGGFGAYNSGSAVLNGVTNTGNITILSDFAAGDDATYAAIGGVSGYNATTITDAVNKGNITVCGKWANHGVYVGGISGYNYNKVTCTGCKSKGNIALGTAEKPFENTLVTKVGGVIGWVNTKTSVLSTGVNIGIIDLTHAAVGNKADSFVGGFVGMTTASVSDSEIHSNIIAPDFVNRGMVMGSTRTPDTVTGEGEEATTTAGVQAKNCKVGGMFVTGWDDSDAEPRPVGFELSEYDFATYIYGGSVVDWTGTENYDGCSFLAVKPTIE